MTIETHMSFPEEGGTECPPDENPLPAASSNPSSPASSEVSTGDSHSQPSNTKKYKSWSNKSKKVISNSQRRKLRSSNKNLPLQCSKSEESSKETGNEISANNNEIDKNDKCTSTNNSASPEEEKDEEAKKSNKTKLLGGEGSKEEAASRKSMRLRLRRGKADNSDDIFGIKERPRYVEDLISIDFNNDSCKIMFMDALGMSFNPKKAKLELVPSEMTNAIAPCNLQNNKIVLENKLEEKVVCHDCDRVNIDKCGAKETIVMKTHEQNIYEFTGCVVAKSEIIGSSETAISNKSIINDDDDGWECWIQRLSSSYYAVKPVPTSPTKKEINESLIRLVRLGTEVKVITNGLS